MSFNLLGFGIAESGEISSFIKRLHDRFDQFYSLFAETDSEGFRVHGEHRFCDFVAKLSSGAVGAAWASRIASAVLSGTTTINLCPIS